MGLVSIIGWSSFLDWPLVARGPSITENLHVADAEVNCIYVLSRLKTTMQLKHFPYGFKENSPVRIKI